MKAKTVFIALFVLMALSLRMMAVFMTTELPRDDALEYDRLAAGILSGRGYVGEDGLPTSFRPPLYPFALSVVYFIFGHSYLAVRICQAILGTATVFLFYLIGRSVYSEKVGIMAAFFAAVYPSYVILTKFLFTETLFTFILALSVYIFLKMRKLVSAGTAVILGVALGVLSLTRPSAIFLLGVYILLLFMSVPINKARRALYFAVVMLVSCFIVLAPWSYRNMMVHHKLVFISSNGGLNFYQSVSPVGGKIFGLVPNDENIEKSKTIAGEADRDAFLFSKGAEKIIHNPLAAARLALIRALFYWGFFDWEVQRGVEYNYLYGFMLPFFLCGCIFGLRRIRSSGILLAVIAYFFLMILVSQGTVRYRLPTDGYLFIVGSYGISCMIEMSKNRMLALSAVSAYFFANYAVFVKSASFKIFLKSLMGRIGLW